MIYVCAVAVYVLWRLKAWQALWFIGISVLTICLWVFGWCFFALVSWLFFAEEWRHVYLLPSLFSLHLDAASSPAGLIGSMIYIPIDVLRWTLHITFVQAVKLGVWPLPASMLAVGAVIGHLWWRWMEYAMSRSDGSSSR